MDEFLTISEDHDHCSKEREVDSSKMVIPNLRKLSIIQITKSK